MITIDDALEIVLAHARPLPPITVPLAMAAGCVLADDVSADIDSPPFDKSVVDGFAIRSIDKPDPAATVRLQKGEWIAAGMTPTRALAPGEAATIMTGAPIPPGCDAVVMHEQTQTAEPGWVELVAPVRAGQNILRRGREMKAGQVVVPRGTLLHPVWLGVLASVGKSEVSVIAPPRVTIVPTGDELVEPGQPLQPGQIRNSNAILLETMARSLGAIAHSSPIAPDDPPRLRAILEIGLDTDLLIITGGVSAGDRDFVPAALLELGVQPLFHKVRLKPGKPIWFGVGPDRPGRPPALVFGLPGNPVSGLVGFLLLVSPALALLAGRGTPPAESTRARLAAPFTHRGDRQTLFPARRVTPTQPDSLPWIQTLDWAGSADLLTTALADGFAVFPAGNRDYATGEIVAYHPLR